MIPEFIINQIEQDALTFTRITRIRIKAEHRSNEIDRHFTAKHSVVSEQFKEIIEFIFTLYRYKSEITVRILQNIESQLCLQTSFLLNNRCVIFC